MICLRGNKKERGFTLIEMLVGLIIFTILSAIVLLFFIQSSNLWQVIVNQSDLRSVARNAINSMSQELRSATRTSTLVPLANLQIPASPNNNSVDFYLPSDIDGNGTIIDAIGNTEWDINNEIQYQYVPAQRQLIRLEGGVQTIIANEVQGVVFEDHSIDVSLMNDELRIILTLQRTTMLNKPVTIALTSIVKLRNQ